MADKKDTKVTKDTKTKKPKTEETVKDLKDIGAAVSDSAVSSEGSAEKSVQAKKEPKIDDKGRSYATGRRKDAVARVWIKPGSGKVVVNGKEQNIYFTRHTHRLILNQPFLIVDRVGKFDVICTVKGGGLSGQAGAVRHGISRALENFEPTLRPSLKKAGMMTRDDRIVERKKVGKHKARRTKQWAKR